MQNNQPIAKLIQHKPPFVLIDKMTRCEVDEAEGEVCFPAGHWIVRHHCVPSSILIESLSQLTAAMEGLHTPDIQGQSVHGMLVAVRNFQFERKILAGSPIHLKIVVQRRLHPFVLAQATAMQDDQVLAQGHLRFFVDRTATQTS